MLQARAHYKLCYKSPLSFTMWGKYGFCSQANEYWEGQELDYSCRQKKSTEKLSVSWKECCQETRQWKRVEKRDNNKTSIFLRSARCGRGSGWVDARRFFTTTTRKTLARTNRAAGSCRGMHCSSWVPSSGEKSLPAIREEFFLRRFT